MEVNYYEHDNIDTPLPEDLMKLKWNGQFKLMQEMIDLRLKKDIPAKLKERLELEKELISRFLKILRIQKKMRLNY